MPAFVKWFRITVVLPKYQGVFENIDSWTLPLEIYIQKF